MVDFTAVPPSRIRNYNYTLCSPYVAIQYSLNSKPNNTVRTAHAGVIASSLKYLKTRRITIPEYFGASVDDLIKTLVDCQKAWKGIVILHTTHAEASCN